MCRMPGLLGPQLRACYLCGTCGHVIASHTCNRAVLSSPIHVAAVAALSTGSCQRSIYGQPYTSNSVMTFMIREEHAPLRMCGVARINVSCLSIVCMCRVCSEAVTVQTCAVSSCGSLLLLLHTPPGLAFLNLSWMGDALDSLLTNPLPRERRCSSMLAPEAFHLVSARVHRA